jgi:hypothetical protein
MTGLWSPTEMERQRYRGYQIEPRREWSNWCVSVQPMRPDLPILPRSILRSLTPHKDDAVTKAKKTIDRLLSTGDGGLG